MKSDLRPFVIDSEQPLAALKVAAPRRRQRLGVIARPVLLGGVRKPEVISSPFHSNYLKSFAGCWWARRPGRSTVRTRSGRLADRCEKHYCNYRFHYSSSESG